MKRSKKSPHLLVFDDIRFGIEEKEIEPMPGGDDGAALIIGQDRAMKALTLGTEIRAKGYNIFVTGLPGTGKQSTVMRMLGEQAGRTDRLRDIVYVFNFQRPESPQALYFPPGFGLRFKKALHQLVENLKNLIKAKLSSDGFNGQKGRLVSKLETEESRVLAEFETKLAADGFKIVQVEQDDAQATDIMPMVDGEAVDFDRFQKLVAEGRIDETRFNDAREQYFRSMDEMRALFLDLRKKRSMVEEDLEALKIQVVEMDVQIEVEHLREEFPFPKVEDYLQALEQDILRNIYIFSEDNPPRDPSGSPAFVRYGVNVLVDHSETLKAPVVLESHPDYPALFGSQEVVPEQSGEARSSFMSIRPGALIRASGGFLVLRAEDILNEEDAWNSLKRALSDGRTEIRNPPGPFGAQPNLLKPEPVEIEVKVVIMGNEYVYDALYARDDDFPKLFKVMAEFDSMMERNAGNTRRYLGFIRKIAIEEGLLPADASGLTAALEYGVRTAEFRDKLTTRFSLVADLVREADYWARKHGRAAVSREAVETTLAERRFLHNLPEEKIDEQVLSGEILIRLSGAAVGRVNGLAILDRGYYSFGRPLVISARTAPGHDGIINIERESGLSGEIHDKGVLIIGGYLQSMYSRDFPLSMRASICFEQSYIEIDGDSASSAEVYALLSAVAGLPLRQDVAATGSVSQMGEMQPVGGVSEKIEGFYEVCRKTGLTGTQGVMIPRLNIPNLILSREVQEAVRTGRFHIWAVSNVDEGMEILTGLPAGARGAKGRFPAGSVNAAVEKKLKAMALLVKDFGGN